MNGVGVSGDGSRIVSGSDDNTVRVWDAKGVGAILKGHTSKVLSVSFSGDGSRIVSGSVDRTVRVWDGGNGQTLLELKGHSSLKEASRSGATV